MQTCGLLCVENRVVSGLAGGVAYFGDDAADGDVGVHIGDLRDDGAVMVLTEQGNE